MCFIDKAYTSDVNSRELKFTDRDLLFPGPVWDPFPVTGSLLHAASGLMPADGGSSKGWCQQARWSSTKEVDNDVTGR